MNFRTLQEEVTYLREHVVDLEAALRRYQDEDEKTETKLRIRFDFTPMEAKFAAALLHRPRRSYESVYHALYGDHGDPPDTKVLDQWLSRVRKALRPHGVEISTIRGFGVELPTASRTRLRELLDNLEGEIAARR